MVGPLCGIFISLRSLIANSLAPGHPKMRTYGENAHDMSTLENPHTTVEDPSPGPFRPHDQSLWSNLQVYQTCSADLYYILHYTSTLGARRVNILAYQYGRRLIMPCFPYWEPFRVLKRTLCFEFLIPFYFNLVSCVSFHQPSRKTIPEWS